MKFLVLTFLILSCSKVEPSLIDADLTAVKIRVQELDQKAADLVDQNGWLVSNSCDSMLWSSKFCDGMEMESAEIDGRLYRRPSKDCWVKDREIQESGSTFSRDMGELAVTCAYRQENLGLIERHIAYGKANSWVMGEGKKSRIIYSPSIISLWYKAARILGHDYGYVEVGNIYPKGLDDFEAHLQVMDIYNRFTMDKKISKTMLKRINEHADREPNCGFYQSMKAKFSGELKPAIDLCLGDSENICSYVRCGDELEKCKLAEKIFSCRIILE